MFANRASRGVPLPTVWQLLVMAATVCAGWLGWTEFRQPAGRSHVVRGAETDQLAEAVEHLQAVEAIARSGPDGIPELVAALENSNPRLRRNAALVLRRFGPAAHAAIGPLRERLADEDGQVRHYVIDTYWHIRRDPDDVARVVAPLLGDQDPPAREAVANVLEMIGPPAVRPLIDVVQSSAVAARVPALKALRRIGWEKSQTQYEELMRGLSCDPDEDDDVRLEALLTLVRWGRPTPHEIRKLLSHEPEDSLHRRWYTEPGPHVTALYAMIRQGPGAVANLPDVLALLGNERTIARPSTLALTVLWRMKEAALPAAPRLFELFDERHDSSRFEVAWTLLEIGAEPHEIVRIVTPLLADPDDDICFYAGRLCALASPEEARRQVSVLIPKLAADRIAGERSALHALWGLAPEAQEAIPALGRLLGSPNQFITFTAIKTLGDIRSDAALPVLLSELESGRRDRVVLSALCRIGNTDPRVLAALRVQLSNEDEYAQIEALGALVRLTPQSPEVLSDLLNWLRGNKGTGRAEVMLAITRLAVDRQNAVPTLVSALADSDPEIRKVAAFTLGKMGHEAATALPALHEALTDWQNSFYNLRAKSYVRPPDGPQSRLNMARWGDGNDRLLHGEDIRRFRETPTSVQQAVRRAISEIDPAAKP